MWVSQNILVWTLAYGIHFCNVLDTQSWLITDVEEIWWLPFVDVFFECWRWILAENHPALLQSQLCCYFVFYFKRIKASWQRWASAFSLPNSLRTDERVGWWSLSLILWTAVNLSVFVHLLCVWGAVSASQCNLCVASVCSRACVWACVALTAVSWLHCGRLEVLTGWCCFSDLQGEAEAGQGTDVTAGSSFGSPVKYTIFTSSQFNSIWQGYVSVFLELFWPLSVMTLCQSMRLCYCNFRLTLNSLFRWCCVGFLRWLS